MTFSRSSRTAAGLCIALSAATAHAHTGHGTSSFYEGIIHPFGLDHLLAMIAVGIWSVSALPGNKVWQGPATFMAALAASAAIGTLGVALPYLDVMISLSVVLFGAMLLATRVKLDTATGLALIAMAAALHGFAHGSEAPPTGIAAYAVGFLLTTAALHFGGIATGLSIKRCMPAMASAINASLGMLFGGAGVYLLSQL